MATVHVIGHDSADRFDRDPERSYTLRSRYYIDPGIYEREKEAIFYESWNFVGHIGQLPDVGSYFECTVADQNLFVVRAKGGELRAFYNVCPHRAHELVRGSGRKKVITCPYHAWSFHLDGRLRTARRSERVAGFDSDEFCLEPVQVEEFAGFLFVNLDTEAPSLKSRTGDLADEMRRYCPDLDRLTFARRLSYDVAANWKNVVDNFLECYHCTPAHPAFVDLVDIDNYRSKTYDIHSSHISPPGRPDNQAYGFEASAGDNNDFAGWWIWPNVTFNTFPGSSNMTVFHILPTGPETTRSYFDFYFMDATPSACEIEAIRYCDEVLQVEDIGLVESVQRGLHSRGYNQGRFIVDRERSQYSEHAVHHFHALVLDALAR